MSGTFEVVPEGFEPSGETPLEDFIARFVEVKYMIDPGEPQEKTVVFPNDDTLFAGPGRLFPDLPEGSVFVNPTTLGKLEPLSVGGHIVDVYWALSNPHCDGVGVVIGVNCLPAGENPFATIPFEVTPGHN